MRHREAAPVQNLQRARIARALVGGLLLAVLVLADWPVQAQQQREVVVVELDGAIDKVTSRFLSRALKSAAATGAELVVIRLDTPGGLVDATREMVRDIFASPVPVVVFVAPEGARAASAGTFIAAAAGLAAMAPATNIGAASVVGGQGEDLPDTLGRKATEDAAALVRAIADERDRNREALEATVFEAKAYSAEEAVDVGIVDLVADDLDDLLIRLDGKTIPVRDGTTTVSTTNLSRRDVGLSFVERVLSFLSNPSVTFLLITLGGLALVIELINFGAIIPGVLGVAMLVLGFAGLGQLPFSWAGVAMIGIAMVLFFLEAQAPGIGVFGVAGTVALILGGLFLVGFFGAPGLPGGPRFRVNPWIVVGVGAAVGAAVTWLAWELRRAQRMPGYVSSVAREALIGQAAKVTERLDPSGEVRVAGEFWEAALPPGQSAEVGTSVRVVDIRGLVLHVQVESTSEDQVQSKGTQDRG